MSDIKEPGNKEDRISHGTGVAILAAGKDYGTAKGATVMSVKVGTGVPSGGTELHPYFDGFTDQFTNNGASDSNTETVAFFWLSLYANPGDIVNWSRGVWDDRCLAGGEAADNIIDEPLEAAMRAAHRHGIIIVVGAHNDGCNTEGHTPTRMGRYDEVFVVGGTSRKLLYGDSPNDLLFQIIDENGTTKKRSRTGPDVSVFAPAKNVRSIGYDSKSQTYRPNEDGGSGTSMATAYVSGLLATACQALEQQSPLYLDYYCKNPENLYALMRGMSTEGSVVDYSGNHLDGYGNNGSALFLYKSW